MTKAFELHKAIRARLLCFLDEATPEQLALIPEGVHNDILWNIALCGVTQHLLCYKLAGVQPYVSEELINTYKKGTSPDGHIPSQEEIATLRQLLNTTHEQIITDYEEGLFNAKEYPIYETSFGYTLHNVEEAILFNNTHEGMHIGTTLALRYFV